MATVNTETAATTAEVLLNPGSPHAAYRQAMVKDARIYDKNNAERIGKRAYELEKIRKAGGIVEDSE